MFIPSRSSSPVLSSPPTSPVPRKEQDSNIFNVAFKSLLDLFEYNFTPNYSMENITNLLNPAEFTSFLTRTNGEGVFASVKSYEGLKYEDALLAFRENVEKELKIGALSEESQQIAKRMMTQPSLPMAYKILPPYLYKQKASQAVTSLSEFFKLDRQCIKANSQKAGQGAWHKNLSKLSGEVGMFFDPHINGNLPFLLGKRNINGSEVNVLRHPVPTVETHSGRIRISEEYRAFLSECESKGEKVLYCCLLNPHASTDKNRVDALYELGPQYDNTFHFIRMPLDGPLSKMDHKKSLEEYKTSIERDVGKSVKYPRSQNREFIFGSTDVANIVGENYQEISQFAYDQIVKVYGEDKGCEEEKKQAFMMLFCTILKSTLIQKMNITYYNNTCKDAIDRGAAHLMSDLIWDSFLTGNVEENKLNLRMCAAWPAFMAKTQAVLDERASWMDSFAKWTEKASLKGLREEIALEYLEKLGLVAEANITFNNPKMTYSQTESDIKQKATEHKAPKNIKVHIPIQIEPDQDVDIKAIVQQSLAKALDELESQYGLSLTVSREEPQYIVQENGDFQDVEVEQFNLEAKDTHSGNKFAEVRARVSFQLKKELESGSFDLIANVHSEIEVIEADYEVVDGYELKALSDDGYETAEENDIDSEGIRL